MNLILSRTALSLAAISLLCFSSCDGKKGDGTATISTNEKPQHTKGHKKSAKKEYKAKLKELKENGSSKPATPKPAGAKPLEPKPAQ